MPIDSIEHMFDTSPDELDAQGALALATCLRATSDAAEARLLEVACHFADLHPVADGAAAGFVVPGMEQVVPLAGEGTPEVAEFAPAELGAALRITTAAAQSLIGEALELRHRLPRCWRRVQDFELPSWRARLVARQTMGLSMEAADFVDRQVAPVAHKLTTYRATKVVDAALLRFDPEKAAETAVRSAERRGVRLWKGSVDGTVDLAVTCDAGDGMAFDRSLEDLAAALGRLGDEDSHEVRRSKEVGILADPHAALDLLAGGGGSATPQGAGSHSEVLLHVHVDGSSLDSGTGVARVEEVGTIVLGAVKRWLGEDRADFTVVPVLDLTSEASVDAHEIPVRMAEAERTRTPYCVFPWCNRPARECDLDHTVAYQDPDEGGPPGQTAPDNLGPLCRRHHRLKTHGRWRLDQPENGVFIWTSPHGAQYRVDGSGTTILRDAA